MSFSTPETSSRRTIRTAGRRSRRRPAILGAGLAFGIVACVGLTATAPAAGATASPTLADFSLASYSTAAPSSSAASESDAGTTLTHATTSIAAAATVTADIASSGLDIGVADTTVDTTALATATERLQSNQHIFAPLASYFTDGVTAQLATVDAEVSTLQGALDGAKAKKAADDAAAAKKAADAAAAAAKAKASASTSTSTTAAAPTSVSLAAAGTSAAEAQAIAQSMLAARGWGDDQFACLVPLWNRESGWRVNAGNASGAYGIPQALPGVKMASAGADWATSASTQISWGLGYIAGRYGTPCGAWAHSQSTGWY